MTADEVAVIPIIMLLVAVATLSGTPMARFISGTFTMPPPTPSSADTMPANTAPAIPTGKLCTAYPGPDRLARSAVPAAVVGPESADGRDAVAMPPVAATSVASPSSGPGTTPSGSGREGAT